ncbi:MAG: aminotransferase class IV [Runella sp.]
MPLSMFIETIRLTDGQFYHLNYHNQRLNQTRRDHFDGVMDWDLNNILEVPHFAQSDTWKCRLTYSRQIENIEFEPYTPRLIRSLRLVETLPFDYNYKYQNRNHLNNLFEQRGNADDVLIIVNGHITDTSYSNIVFWDGQQWLTPATPLLRGIQRTRLLAEDIIKEQKIKAEEIYSFSSARLINAMLDFDNTPVFSTQAIYF